MVTVVVLSRDAPPHGDVHEPPPRSQLSELSRRPDRSPVARASTVVVALAVASLGILLLSAPADAARPRTAPARAVIAAPPTERLLGVAVPGAPTDLREYEDLGNALGRRPEQVTFYAAWATVPDFPAADAARIAAAGAVPELTWEPWDPAAGTTQPAYALDRIAAGAHDAYLKRWARQVRSYGAPLVIRMAHEMNGSWYPWAEGVNGNEAGDYRAAWRHVVKVFRAQRVTNVSWFWAPNVPFHGSVPLAGLYPGDDVVDRVGLDGYNWGTTQTWSSWQSAEQVFGPGLAEISTFTSRPFFIGEVGSAEQGGDKGAWLRDMWAWLDRTPAVRGLTWFHFDKEADWRIWSSPGSFEAFRAGYAAFR